MNIDGLMEMYIRVYGGIVYLMEKVNLDGLMEMYTVVHINFLIINIG